MENKIDENDEISIIELSKIIWKRKIVVVLATIIIGLLGALSVKFLYNNSDEYYTSMIYYSFPGVETGKYPDGSVFDYHDIVSTETLQEIVFSDPEFGDIDISKMVLGNSIEIIKAADEKGQIINNTYTLNFSKSYFKNKKVARKFAEAVLSYPIIKANNAIDGIKYDKYLMHFESMNNTYSEKINMIMNQYNYLTNEYENIIAKRGDYLLSDGLNITDKINSLKVLMNDSSINTLYQELEQNGFVNNPLRERNILEVQLNQYKIKIENNTKIIDDLTAKIDEIQTAGITGSMSIFEEYNKIIAQKIVENVDLEYKKSVIEKQIDIIDNGLENAEYNSNKAIFDAKLNTAYDSLSRETESYKAAYKEVYKENNNCHFEYSGVIISKGGISPIIALALFGIIGFAGSSVIAVIIEKNKEKKNEDQ